MASQPDAGTVADGQPGDRLAGPGHESGFGPTLARAVASVIGQHMILRESPEQIAIAALLAIGEHARIVPKQPATAARPDLDRLQEIYDRLAKGRRPGDQQLPVPNDGPSMHDLVIADLDEWAQGQSQAATEAVKALLLERKRLGLERYGSLLQSGNGRSWRRDLAEELCDAAVYAMQGLEEDGTPDPMAALSEVYMHILSALFWAQRIPGADRG